MLRLPQALFIFCSRDLFHFRILEKPVLSGGVNMKCEGRKENKHKNEMRENDRSF